MSLRILLRLFYALVLLFPGSMAWGDTGVPDARAELARHPEWLALLHYPAPRLGRSFASQADDPAFFLSTEGKHSPEAELRASLDALLQPASDDASAVCRFPARAQWLRRQLGQDEPNLQPCHRLNRWMAELNTERVTLVFAASYLNSPSSMFGHTLLRLDPPQGTGETDLLLASTISYAADAAAHDNELMFAYRGIFGGYPGVTSVQPYYEKILLYSDLENRDLWEYQLNLNAEETRRLLLHAWEVQDKRFDYYFFDENCAYRLLALIDVARPGTGLLQRVNTHAIPSDTVRWVLDSDLVADIGYRPSAATSVSHQLERLVPEQRRLARALAEGRLKVGDPPLQALDAGSRAQLLDASYEYVRYAATEHEWPRERAAPLSYDLLSARSRILGQETPGSPPTPAVRDDQGHDTLRLSAALGRSGGRDYLELGVRPAYHDLLDPPEGYREGAQLQFLRLDARRYADNAEWQLERFVAVEIRSLSPRDDFFKPLSWQVGFGARRSALESGQRILTPYLDGGAGFAYRLGGGQLHLLATGDLELDSDLPDGYAIAPGLDLGYLRQGPRFSLLGGVRSKLWRFSDGQREDQLYLGGAWHLGRDYSISVGASRSHRHRDYENQWQLALHAYY